MNNEVKTKYMLKTEEHNELHKDFKTQILAF